MMFSLFSFFIDEPEAAEHPCAPFPEERQQARFDITPPEPVDAGADDEDDGHGCGCIAHAQPCRGKEVSGAVHGLVPQPLPHGGRIGMYEQHPEGGCPQGIYEPGMWYLQVLEVHERGHCNEQRQELVAVGNEKVGIVKMYVSELVYGLEQEHAGCAAGNKDQREDAPHSVAYFGKQTVEPDVGRNDIYCHEPAHVVELNLDCGHGGQQGVEQQENGHEVEMLPAVDVFQEDIEKRYEQVEHQEAADKVAGVEAFQRPERPHELERRQSLMACDTENAVDYY